MTPVNINIIVLCFVQIVRGVSFLDRLRRTHIHTHSIELVHFIQSLFVALHLNFMRLVMVELAIS